MGLDMYLNRKTYIHRTLSDNIVITVKYGDKDHPYINPNKINYITEEVGYWRKANQIHNWFVQNCQDGEDDCNSYPVSINQLEKLLDICKSIIAAKDTNVSAKELPRVRGFFFGGDEYDDEYYKDIQNTIEILTPLIDTHKKLLKEKLPIWADYYYQSSW